MSRRPNILVVCTDQQRTDTLSCYGAKHIKTPGFDRIAREGIRFDRAYAASAVCTPSRVSLLSGQYAGRHGVWSIGVNTGDDVRMIQHELRDAGYRTGLIGKAHLEAYQATPDQSQESIEGFEAGYGNWSGPYYGFDEVQLALGHVNYGMTGHYGAWLLQRHSEADIARFKQLRPRGNNTSFGGEAYDWDLPLASHNSVWTGDRAVEFIEGHRQEDPFFLFVSFQDPHHPHALPTEFENRVCSTQVPDPIYTEGELDARPPHFKLAREGKLSDSRFVGNAWPMAGQPRDSLSQHGGVHRDSMRKSMENSQVMAKKYCDNVWFLRTIEILEMKRVAICFE
ncbi:MAG: sulfatase-like hydrolase/transferase [Halanaerobiales bacterium]|nr:sulfatase-like hydrolase/transferase [Halanaerobiales bacterium]